MVSSNNSAGKLAKTLCPQLAADTESEAILCECGLRFADRGSLYVHQAEQPKINSHLRPRLTCHGLPLPPGFIRPSSSALLHYKTEDIQCPKCPKRFKFSLGFSQHYGKVHQSSKRPTKCPECQKKFKNKHAVNFHVAQVHSDGKRVQCEFCEKFAYNKYTLQVHLKKCGKRHEVAKQTVEE